ncbi:MAG: MBL fold metallo-hydrolase, partial [Candidatus Cloacimonadaceae bacterium]
MVRIIIHRGGHEIGGSAVEIRSTGGRILLDLGAPLDFDTRAAADIDALRQRGVLQRIQGLYADDTPSFDAILLSHAHLDHSGLLPFAHPDIPLALSSGSRVLMELGTRFLKYPVLPNRQVIFEMYRTFSIADMEITPYLIDHSAFDAAAFEIFTDGRRIVYTGDFRRHGRKAASFERFMRRVTPAPDVLLCEGT